MVKLYLRSILFNFIQTRKFLFMRPTPASVPVCPDFEKVLLFSQDLACGRLLNHHLLLPPPPPIERPPPPPPPYDRLLLPLPIERPPPPYELELDLVDGEGDCLSNVDGDCLFDVEGLVEAEGDCLFDVEGLVEAEGDCLFDVEGLVEAEGDCLFDMDSLRRFAPAPSP